MVEMIEPTMKEAGEDLNERQAGVKRGLQSKRKYRFQRSK